MSLSLRESPNLNKLLDEEMMLVNQEISVLLGKGTILKAGRAQEEFLRKLNL